MDDMLHGLRGRVTQVSKYIQVPQVKQVMDDKLSRFSRFHGFSFIQWCTQIFKKWREKPSPLKYLLLGSIQHSCISCLILSIPDILLVFL